MTAQELDSEVVGTEYGHPQLFHDAVLGDAGAGWYDEIAIEAVDEDEAELSADEECSPPKKGMPAAPCAGAALRHMESTRSLYGLAVQKTGDDLKQIMPAGDGGMTWHAQVLADNFQPPAKQLRPDGTLKPRRPLPLVRAGDFFSSLSKTDDGRWVFTGVLNGWPALTNLELVSVTVKASRLGKSYIKRLWNVGDAKAPGALPGRVRGVRVTLRAAPWSAAGFTPQSPGFAFWFRSNGSLVHGEQMVAASRAEAAAAGGAAPKAARVHHFAHRYATEHESAKDRLTWHAAILIEWDHGRHCTVLELAWLGGLGGYGGKSNWYADRDAKRTALYDAMPAELKLPWRTDRSEVRVLDVEAKDLGEFEAYLKEYTGPKARFLDPTIAASSEVRLSHRSRDDVLRYVLNYVRNEPKYSEQTRNCQTFAADLFALLSGNSATEPFSGFLRPFYKQRLNWMLCDPPEGVDP